MKGINKVILVGFIGDNPELKHIGSNQTPFAAVSVATPDFYRDGNGDKVDTTEWHRLVFWRKLAEIVSQYCSKGSKIYVEGSLQTKQWEDKDGNKRTTTQIVVNQLSMLDSKGSTKQAQHEPQAITTGANFNYSPDDELPF